MRARVRAAGAASAVLAALVFHATSDLRAAPPGASSESSVGAPPPRLVAPKLVSDVAPPYPPSLVGSGRHGDVQLLLDIDERGAVVQARIVSSSDPGFDDAAVAAAHDLRFDPATRDGRPIPARIPFRFSFADVGPPTEPPTPDAPRGGNQAADASPNGPTSRSPQAQGAEAAQVAGTTQIAGATEVAPAGPAPSDAPQEINVQGERVPREPTRRILEAREFRKVPGANGDPLRVIETLPGVARPPGLSGLLIVRGTGPADTNVFVDGTWIPAAYHFGGMTSVVPGDVLSRISFVPGNYGPEYGRGHGGIVELGLRSPRRDRFGGLVQIDMLDGRFLVETPLGPRARVLLAGRRSWIDAWFGPVMRDAKVDVPAAPVYYDGQAILEYDLTEHTKARLVAFGSDDRFAMVNPSPDAADPGEGGDLDLASSFSRVQARIDSQLAEHTKLSQMLSFGSHFSRFRLGPLRTQEHVRIAEARTDLRHKITRGVTAFGGLDIQFAEYEVGLFVPRGRNDDLEGGDGVEAPLYGTQLRKLEGQGTVFRPAAFVGLDLRPFTGLQVIPSLRVDYADDTRRTKVDPRLSMRWDVVRGGYSEEDGAFRRRTTLKAGAGVYRRPPQPSESLPPWGQSGLNVPRSFHASLGIEQELAPGIDLSLEGFAKWMDLLVVSEDAMASSANGIRYSNAGQGRIFGGELLLRMHPKGRLFGWVSYTLSRSERRERAGAPWESYQYDQTHILSALAGYDLGGGWEIGARYRLVSGDLYTPYVGGALDLDAGVYAPIGASRPFSARLEPFHRLDLRVDKTFTFSRWKLTAYLDVQNVYNHRPAEFPDYNYAYTQSSAVRGLPILPIVGMRGEL